MIYFLQEQGGDYLIKIGYSGNVSQRAAAIRGKSPIELTVIRTLRGDRKREKVIHGHFLEVRARDEWFRPVPELLALIESPDAEEIVRGWELDYEKKKEEGCGARTTVIRFRATDSEIEYIKERAKQAGKPVSDYFRSLLGFPELDWQSVMKTQTPYWAGQQVMHNQSSTQPANEAGEDGK